MTERFQKSSSSPEISSSHASPKAAALADVKTVESLPRDLIVPRFAEGRCAAQPAESKIGLPVMARISLF